MGYKRYQQILCDILRNHSQENLQRLSFNASERWGAKHSSVATSRFFFKQNKAKQCKTKEKQKRTEEKIRIENKKEKERDKENEKEKRKEKELEKEKEKKRKK